MPTRSEPWPEGTPTWIDLGSEDLEGAKAFYSGLFGWDYVSGGQEAGGYLLAVLDGKAVAGIGPKQDQQMPTVWTSYFGSDDVDATAEKVTESGGHVVAPPFGVMDSGRMAIASDSAGAVFGIWQAGSHIGAERFNEHGALCWTELHTPEYNSAREFYPKVFGGEVSDISEESFVYSTFRRASDGEEVAGMLQDDRLPEAGPAYWLAWFASNDVDASIATALALGGSVLLEPSDSPFGRMAIARGPQGETFGLIAAPPESH
ncbi:VOC family protein [Arthrobacter sp. Y-9]|uniref:VOC family protein n=1 Tax=Arthrobacter sp. Y-9 TaxID=3039385 RepID=UPI00241F6DAB|nr:VOC family protein [Arthrobacter sp. Y-9]WFR84299.1 VOC family protein [Arthrobacter sp. Y-9]